MYPCLPPGPSPWTGAFPPPAPFPPAALGRVARLWVSLLNAASPAARLTPTRGPAWGLGLDPLAAPCLRPSRGPSSQHARAGVSHMDTQSLSGSFSQPHLGPPWDGGPGLLLGSGDQNWMWQGGPGPPSARARGFQGHPGRTPRPAGQASACPWTPGTDTRSLGCPRLHAALLFGPSQAEPAGDPSAPGVGGLPLPLLLQQAGPDVVLGRAALTARRFLRKQVWEREGLSVGLGERGPAPAGGLGPPHICHRKRGQGLPAPPAQGRLPPAPPSTVPACRGNTLGGWAPASVRQRAWQRAGS